MNTRKQVTPKKNPPVRYLDLPFSSDLKRFRKGSFNNYVDQILPISLEWTKTYILHSIYPLSRDPPWTFNWPQPPSSCPRSHWMTPKANWPVGSDAPVDQPLSSPLPNLPIYCPQIYNEDDCYEILLIEIILRFYFPYFSWQEKTGNFIFQLSRS